MVRLQFATPEIRISFEQSYCIIASATFFCSLHFLSGSGRMRPVGFIPSLWIIHLEPGFVDRSCHQHEFSIIIPEESLIFRGTTEKIIAWRSMYTPKEHTSVVQPHLRPCFNTPSGRSLRHGGYEVLHKYLTTLSPQIRFLPSYVLLWNMNNGNYSPKSKPASDNSYMCECDIHSFDLLRLIYGTVTSTQRLPREHAKTCWTSARYLLHK